MRHLYAGQRLCVACLCGDPARGCDYCGGAAEEPASERVASALARMHPDARAEGEACAALIGARYPVPLHTIVWTVHHEPPRVLRDWHSGEATEMPPVNLVVPCLVTGCEARLRAVGLTFSAYARGVLEFLVTPVG